MWDKAILVSLNYSYAYQENKSKTIAPTRYVRRTDTIQPAEESCAPGVFITTTLRNSNQIHKKVIRIRASISW